MTALEAVGVQNASGVAGVLAAAPGAVGAVPGALANAQLFLEDNIGSVRSLGLLASSSFVFWG